MSAYLHTPVLLIEAVAALAPRAGGLYLDGTFGLGGYSSALLEAAACRVIGIDRDGDAIRRGQDLVCRYDGRLDLIHGRFGDMAALTAPALARLNRSGVDGIALDLGVSSPQLDQAERGFSFRFDGPLDMRMGQEGPSAADLVNDLSESALADIVYRYGEERHARKVARAIVQRRGQAAFTRTSQLAETVRLAVPRGRDGIDPATRTFQALRIAVNDELGELDRGLAAAETLLLAGGRLAVVSFHSLEDRAVKNFIRDRSGRAAGRSRHLPIAEPSAEPAFRPLHRKAITAQAREIARNPRARSARLRVAERLLPLAGGR